MDNNCEETSPVNRGNGEEVDEVTNEAHGFNTIQNARTIMVKIMKCIKWGARTAISFVSVKAVLNTSLAAACLLLGWTYSQHVQTGSTLGNTITSVCFVIGACHGAYFGAYGGGSLGLAIYPCSFTAFIGVFVGAMLGGPIGGWTAAMIAENIVNWIGRLLGSAGTAASLQRWESSDHSTSAGHISHMMALS